MQRRTRYVVLIFSTVILCVIAWLAIFFQRKPYLIGGGVNRIFLFLLINAHLLISIVLLYLILRQSIKLCIERRRQEPGSAFKRNLFFAFIIFSVIPVVFVFFIAGNIITRSIDNWFQARIGTGLESGIRLHEERTKEERNRLTQAGEVIAKSLAKEGLPRGEESFQDVINKKISVILKQHREFTDYTVAIWGARGAYFLGSIRDEVSVWRTFRRLNDRTTKSLREEFFEKLRTQSLFDFYGSLYSIKEIQIPLIKEKLLLVLAYRYPQEVRYPLIELENAIRDYSQLKLIRSPIHWSYSLTFLLVTLLIVFLSIWCAFFLARGISQPIKELLLAIKKIRAGDLETRVTIDPSDDLRQLVTGFNEMTLSLQRAYQHLEFHNKEMITMLEHIKESVFFINNYGRILSFNLAAGKLIEKYLHIDRFKNKKVNVLGVFAKETFFHLVKELRETDKEYLAKEISFTHEGEPRTFMIYVSIVQNAVLGMNKGVLVVVEDLSDVYKMNKIKTWREAAEQMAHEIKNPLTPIQLATQRLQRKLRKNGIDDTVLMECTETILQQVKIIKDLVTHFSEFAKMPGSVIELLDINNIIKEVGSLYTMSYPEIAITYDLEKFLPAFKADNQRMKRVIVNLLDNSVRALQKKTDGEPKLIVLKTSFKTGRNQIEVLISDNGPGIPRDVREKLFLPYVSSGSKNMGLGLAIVHDIVTQAGGTIKLLPSQQGALFQILLPV